jgi:hypothetical protein
MILNKHTIHGEKGKTVCYSMPDFRFDASDNKLKWGAFRFYTPEGGSVDEEGFAYFDVPAEEILIQRDESLDKEIIITTTRDNGAEAVEILEGAEIEPIIVGIEGDFVATGFIPASPHQEIVIDYKEVTDG